jgi:hypothetical protein
VSLLKLPSVLLLDDKAGKPEAINLLVGRRPRLHTGIGRVSNASMGEASETLVWRPGE